MATPPICSICSLTLQPRGQGLSGSIWQVDPRRVIDGDLKTTAMPFARARRHGLGRTIHAGEGRPAAEIRFAIEHLNAQRIGHGLSLADDAELVDLVIASHVTIEACPTSNWHTGIIESISAHPIKHWLGLGVAVAICTDNTLFSNVDLPTELRRTSQSIGLSDEEVAVIHQAAHQARFIS